MRWTQHGAFFAGEFDYEERSREGLGTRVCHARLPDSEARFLVSCRPFKRTAVERGSLEAQLLDALIQKLTPDVLADAINRSQAEEYLKGINTAVAKDGTAPQARLAELKKQQATVTRAIPQSGGKFQGLLSELETIDTEIKAVQHQLAQASEGPKDPGTIDEFKAFVLRKADELREVLTRDRVIAKHAIRQVISRLILTPLQTPGGPAFEVTGDVDLFATDGPLMLSGGGTAARDKRRQIEEAKARISSLQRSVKTCEKKLAHILRSISLGFPTLPVRVALLCSPFINSADSVCIALVRG
jgi:hypothetical protein